MAMFRGSSSGHVCSYDIGLGGGYSSDFGRGHEIRHKGGRDWCLSGSHDVPSPSPGVDDSGRESVLEGGLGFNHDEVMKPGGGDCGDVGGTRPGR